MTRAAFLEAYGKVIDRYPWAVDAAKRGRFMAAVLETLDGTAVNWAWDGAGAVDAWRAIGGTGKPTLKQLRALP